MPTKTPVGLDINFQKPKSYKVSRTCADPNDPKSFSFEFTLIYEKGIVNNKVITSPYNVYSRISILNKEGKELEFIERNGWKLTYKSSVYEGKNRDFFHYKILDPSGETMFQIKKAEPTGTRFISVLREFAERSNQNSYVSVPDDFIRITPNRMKVEISRRIQEKLEELKVLEREYLSMADYDSEDVQMVWEVEPFHEYLRSRSEAFLYNYLIDRYSPKRVKWMNMEGENFQPYDFIIYDESHKILHYVDCKGTAMNKPTFYMTDSEWTFFLDRKEVYQIYRVFNVSSEMTFYEISNLHKSITKGEVVPYSQKSEVSQANRVALTIK